MVLNIHLESDLEQFVDNVVEWAFQLEDFLQDKQFKYTLKNENYKHIFILKELTDEILDLTYSNTKPQCIEIIEYVYGELIGNKTKEPELKDIREELGKLLKQ